MVLGTGRTPLEVRAHSGDAGVGVGSPQLQLDVAIELGEAFLAAQLGPLVVRAAFRGGCLGSGFGLRASESSPALRRYQRRCGAPSI